ncbi:MAG: LamG-like jellyroll fold domain-containing protein, partial [Candidatus Micrarchaeia archaeon]
MALYFSSSSASAIDPSQSPDVNQSSSQPFQVVEESPYRAYCVETGAQLEISVVVSKRSSPLASISIIFPDVSRSEFIPENLSERKYGITFIPETEGRYDVEFSSGQPGQRVETVYFYAYPPGSDPVELGYRCTNIKGRNKPPVLITDISDISFEEGHNATLNLSGNFRDSDKDALVFTSSPSDSVIVSFQGSIATVSALQGFAGSEHIVFYASDGRSIVPSNTVTVMVGPAQSNISENASVSTVQYEARTGQPVRWKKTVSLASPQSVSVYIPASASVISIRDSANGNDLGPGAVKPSRWQDQKIVDISEPVTELEVLYETPGPASEERNTGKRSKEVLISSDIHYENISANASLPVEIPSAELATLAWHVSSEEGLPKNSLSRAEISELEQNGVLVKEVPFTARDTNGNGLLDAIEWIVPSLSNQTYEISISVLNIHSHPTLYGNWAVEFITLGEANLTVTATNEPNYTSEYTRWSDSLEENYDLKFLELRCGNETFQYQWLGSDCLSEECSVFAENYSCNETSYETSKVLSAKKHVLKFQFGDEAVYAYNDAANITLNSITLNSTYGANTTRENLTIYVNATDAEGDNISIAYDWRLNGSSIAVLNMNFDVNNSAGAGKTRDYSSYENNGTVTDAVWSATGGWNGTGAYSYGSTGSYIDAGSSQSLNITGKEITLEAWVYHASNPDNDGIIFKGPLTNSQGTYSLVYVNNVYFRLNGAIVEGSGQVGTSDGPYANNVWHHLVATYDGADQRIYVDGIQKNSQPYTSDIGDSGADSLKIGTYYSTGYPFGGNIDNINIYDRALSPQEITAHYQNRSDLMVSQELAAGQNWTVCATPNDGSADGTTNCSSALYAQSGAPSINSIILNSTLGANTTQENLTVYVNATDLNNDPVRFAYDWRLNGSSIAILNMNFDVNNSAGAGKTRDYTMFGNNGTVNGATWNATGGWNGTGGYLFSSGNITVPDNDDLEFDKPFSITGWVNPSDISSQFVNYLVTKGSGSASGFYLGFVGSDASTCGGVDGAVYIWNGSSLFCSNTTLTTDAWTFIAATFNGSNTSIYIDGILENSDNAIVYGANAYNLLLGIRNDGSWQYNGYMDQFAYWNRSLTSQEVSALYQNRSDSVVSQELAAGQDWAVCATPNDGILDGATNCSNTLLIRTYENCTDTGGTWTISSNYILNRSVECFSIIVTNNAVLTIDSSPTGANGPVNLSADAVVVEAGSRISADARGYGPGLGPGAGTNRTSGQGTSGGGHGGTGGTGLALTAGGTPYGNITIPTTLGSGGGSISSAYAGSGGGAIFINASRIQVDGIITANGTSGNHSAVGSGTGGGSGGSIWLITENMSGSGTIRADGGRGSTYSGGGYHGGGGAGGRIAIYYSSSSFDGTITAFGGYSGKQYGGAGTVLLVPGSGAGFLVIDNGFPSTSVAYTPWNSSYPVFDNLNVSGGAVLFCNNTPLAVSSDIIVLANSSIAGFPNISVANLTVESQALINSSGLGYGPGLGPGAGANGSCCGGGTGGGGYGGNGGNGLNDYAGGPAYGDVIAPYEIGSGGGAVGDGTGGIGGGKIVISVSERLALEGAIHAEGLNSSHYSTWAQGTGGGSGGSVWITASELNGTGTISVAGAKGSTYSGGGYWGGGGSGGRVSVSYVTNTFSGLVNLSGGSSGYRNGSAGTFFYCSRISNFSSCQDGFGKTLHSVFASNSSQNITRKLYVEWTNDSMMWNESSTNASTVAQYIVYNLTPSASYAIAANGVVLATQSANSSGALGPFTINLSSEQQISLTNVPQVISCIGATASFTCGQNVNESCTMNGDLNATGTNCFNVTASNVSINCAGFTISGNNTFNTQGVYTTVFNTSVRNCNINGFDVGIYYNGATAINGTIENNNVNTSVNNWVDPTYSSAILLRGGASFNTLNNNIANSHYGKGILLYGSCNSNTLTNVTGRNIASGAAGYGIQVSTNSNNNHFIGVSASANQSSGIYIDGGSNAFIDCAGGLIEGTNTSNTWGVYTNQFNTTIKNCNINGFDVGIYYNGAHNGTIENNNINVTVNNYVNPTYSTAILLYGAHFNTLNNNIAYSKDGIGIFLATASNNTVLNNSGVSNSKAGFALYVNSNGNQIIDSKGISTGSYGFFSHSSSNNIITNSNGTTGAVGGFYFTDNSNTHTILNSTGTSGAEGGIYVAGSSNNKIINSTGTAGTYGNLYLQVSDNNSIEGSTFLSSTSYSVFVYSGSDNNTFTNCQISGKNNAYGALLIYASNYDNTIANSTINGLGATYAASLQAGTFTGNIFINNTFLNATNLLLFDAGASNNIICLNNFSDSGTSPTTYITDSNGSNFYSCTYDGKNQGNIYPNVLNGSVEIKGSVNSSIGGLYIGASGAGYPYNSTNSLGKMIGGVDSAPLTAAFISPLLSEIIAPQNNSVIGYANGTLNVAVNYTGSGTGCNATISAGTLAAVGNATQILGTITTGNSTNFTLNLTDAANLYGLNYNVSVNTTCAEVQSFQQISIFVDHTWSITNNFIDQTGTISN